MIFDNVFHEKIRTFMEYINSKIVCVYQKYSKIVLLYQVLKKLQTN